MKKAFTLAIAALSLSVFTARAENICEMPAAADETAAVSGVNAENVCNAGEALTDALSAVAGEYSAMAASASSAYSSAAARNGAWVFGLGLGASFGDYTSISVAPEIGYNWNGFFTLGVGLTYTHYNNSDLDYKLNYFGGHIVGRIYPIRYIHLFVQPEIYRRWGKVKHEYSFGSSEDTQSKTVSCLLLGGGLTLPAGDMGNLNISVYYDVSQDRYSPHGDKVGFSIGCSFRI